MQLDEVSKAIIEQLQDDGRRSYAEIGKAVGLSEAAVRQRVQKLTESGVMQVVAVTDPMQLGFYRQAMIGIRVTGDTTRRRRGARRDPGRRLRRAHRRQLRHPRRGRLRERRRPDRRCSTQRDPQASTGVQSTETFVYLKLHKQFYNWGTQVKTS